MMKKYFKENPDMSVNVGDVVGYHDTSIVYFRFAKVLHIKSRSKDTNDVGLSVCFYNTYEEARTDSKPCKGMSCGVGEIYTLSFFCPTFKVISSWKERMTK